MRCLQRRQSGHSLHVALAHDSPEEAHELPCNGHICLLRWLAAGHKPLVATTQAQLRLVRSCDSPARLTFTAFVQRGADLGTVSVVPPRLDENLSEMGVSRLGDGSPRRQQGPFAPPALPSFIADMERPVQSRRVVFIHPVQSLCFVRALKAANRRQFFDDESL